MNPPFFLLLRNCIPFFLFFLRQPLLYLGEALYGLGGGFALFAMAAFSVSADQSTPATRVVHVSRMEGALFVGEVMGGLVGGVITTHFGFLVTFMTTFGLLALSCFLTLFFRESLAPEHRSHEPVTAALANALSALTIFRNRSVN